MDDFKLEEYRDIDSAFLYDGSWKGIEFKEIRDLMKLDDEKFENLQTYWFMIEDRLKKVPMDSSRMHSIRRVLLDACLG